MAFLRAAVIIWIVTALFGCTTTRTMTQITPERAKSELRVGDSVRLTTVAGQQHELELTAVDETSLWGTTTKGQRLTFKFDDLHALESTRFSVGKTAGAIGGGFVALSVLAAYIFVQALESD